MSYSQQVMAVLVADRQRSIADDRAYARRVGLRRIVASGVYALAKAVTVLAVVLDEDAAYRARERAR